MDKADELSEIQINMKKFRVIYFLLCCAISLFLGFIVGGWDLPRWINIQSGLNAWSGLWGLLQGVGTPIAIFVAIFLPSWQKSRDELNKLIAIRNVAFFHVRYIDIFVSEIAKHGRYDGPITVFEGCLDAFQKTDYTRVEPAFLIEAFVNIVVQGNEIKPWLQKNQPSKGDVLCAESIRNDIVSSLCKIDNYLRSKSVSIDAKNIAHSID